MYEDTKNMKIKDLWVTDNADPDLGTLGFFNCLVSLTANPPVYVTEEGNPIFTWMQIIETTPYTMYKGLSYTALDNLYIMRSGEKYVRQYYKDYLNKRIKAGGSVSSGQKFLAEYITRKYSKKWLDMWETMFYDYEPLWNYDMTETLTDDVKEIEHGHVITLENGKTLTRSGSVTNTPGTTYTETQSIKGLDSTNWTESDKSVSAPSGTGDVTNYSNLKDTASGTDTTRNQGTDTETRNYTLTRHGNIGVTTSMELIQKQRQVVLFNYFDEVVFPDIDREIALKIY